MRKLGVGCVINLCADKLGSRGYEDVPKKLAKAKIHQHILVADDARHFKILEVPGLQVFASFHAQLVAQVLGPSMYQLDCPTDA